MAVDPGSLVVIFLRYFGAFFALIGNAFLIFLFFSHRRLYLAKCHQLVVLLNICDLVIGIGVLVSVTYSLYSLINDITVFDKLTCHFMNVVQGFGIIGGQVVYLAIGLDRLVAVLRPTTYGHDLPHLTLTTALLTATAGLGYSCLKLVDSDLTQPISVCSTGATVGEPFMMANNIYNSVFLVLLFGIYIVSLVFFLLRFNKHKLMTAHHEFKVHVRIFVSVSTVLVTTLLIYGVPLALNVLSTIFNWGNRFQGIVTIVMGHATLLCADINVLLYLFKNQDIRHCALQTARKRLPQNLRVILLKPVVVVSSHFSYASGNDTDKHKTGTR